jgi:thiamine pyrophosphate-dependent acetolactate synthase large subunit-like protein
MQLTGAEALLESLKKEGVGLIFGYPGGAFK